MRCRWSEFQTVSVANHRIYSHYFRVNFIILGHIWIPPIMSMKTHHACISQFGKFTFCDPGMEFLGLELCCLDLCPLLEVEGITYNWIKIELQIDHSLYLINFDWHATEHWTWIQNIKFKLHRFAVSKDISLTNLLMLSFLSLPFVQHKCRLATKI